MEEIARIAARLTLASLCACAASSIAVATPRCDGKLPRVLIDSRQEQTLQLLRDKKFDALQAAMDERLAAYVQGRLTDEELFYEFGAFDRWGPFLTPLFQEWVAKHPDSYAAHHGMALHLSAIAWQRRGGGWVRETSAQQFDEFHQQMLAADEWLSRAIKLHPKPILSYALRISNARAFNARRARPKTWLAEARAVQPDNVVARNAYVVQLAPKWGGSIKELEEFASQSAHPGLAPDRLASVSYTVLMEIADDHLRLEQPQRAIEQYEKAAKSCRLNQPWMNIARIRLEQARHADALAAAEAAIALVPDSPGGWQLKARALKGLGRHREAVDILLRLAPQGTAGVLSMLGEYYASGQGGTKQDLDEARRLLVIAARAGDAHAARLLMDLDTQAKPPAR